ncbi:MAG: PQQ-dependent sugar dehydrogenase [Betaproteobacteria bacterium]
MNVLNRFNGARERFAKRSSLALCVACGTLWATLAGAASLPAGFGETLVVSGLNRPTAMALAPDGRIFVTEQDGTLRVIKDGVLLPAPFLTVTVSNSNERGLDGVTVDPDFATNGFVYVYYTATSPVIHNRVSRFVANGDVAAPGETIVLDLDPLSASSVHNGGAIHFGKDGKLYVAAGENGNSANAQTLTNLLGKILRIDADGGIPTDNPFYASASGVNRAIWVLGLRNPFNVAIQPGTGRIFINDVGESSWEEINDGIAGSNYGWPNSEGPAVNGGERAPIYAYKHSGSGVKGCAITGGAFYNPSTAQFPAGYAGGYFFADFCSGWVNKLDPANGNAVTAFATGIDHPVDLKVDDAGSLYYLARGGGGTQGVLYRINFPASAAPTAIASRKAHGGAGTFDLPVASTPLNPTTEPRSGGTGGNHTIVFTFDKPVTAGTATVTEGTAVAGAPTFAGNTMVIPLSGVANAQYVNVSALSVVGADGSTGGVASARIGFLIGDVNQNRVVSLADLGLVNAQVAQFVTASNYLQDVDASGTLSLADKGITNGMVTKALPPP